jgi:glutamate/tyrosine decarboxylase-like PLP-dependent enzyme
MVWQVYSQAMIKRSMAWDQALLRKFSSTGHFRLLNQVRSELKAQPLNRDPETRELTLQARPLRGQPVRAQRRPNALESSDSESRLPSRQAEAPSSFRERLNAIDMR